VCGVWIDEEIVAEHGLVVSGKSENRKQVAPTSCLIELKGKTK